MLREIYSIVPAPVAKPSIAQSVGENANPAIVKMSERQLRPIANPYFVLMLKTNPAIVQTNAIGKKTIPTVITASTPEIQPMIAGIKPLFLVRETLVVVIVNYYP